jgi:hypothetical protein
VEKLYHQTPQYQNTVLQEVSSISIFHPEKISEGKEKIRRKIGPDGKRNIC